MTPKQFIEKAIEGAWKPRGIEFGISKGGWASLESMMNLVPIEEIVLDPKAWEAVGRVEGWSQEELSIHNYFSFQWRENMHAMIDALIEGKSIEEYLETL